MVAVSNWSHQLIWHFFLVGGGGRDVVVIAYVDSEIDNLLTHCNTTLILKSLSEKKSSDIQEEQTG